MDMDIDMINGPRSGPESELLNCKNKSNAKVIVNSKENTITEFEPRFNPKTKNFEPFPHISEIVYVDKEEMGNYRKSRIVPEDMSMREFWADYGPSEKHTKHTFKPKPILKEMEKYSDLIAWLKNSSIFDVGFLKPELKELQEFFKSSQLETAQEELANIFKEIIIDGKVNLTEDDHMAQVVPRRGEIASALVTTLEKDELPTLSEKTYDDLDLFYECWKTTSENLNSKTMVKVQDIKRLRVGFAVISDDVEEIHYIRIQKFCGLFSLSYASSGIGRTI